MNHDYKYFLSALLLMSGALLLSGCMSSDPPEPNVPTATPAGSRSSNPPAAILPSPKAPLPDSSAFFCQVPYIDRFGRRQDAVYKFTRSCDGVTTVPEAVNKAGEKAFIDLLGKVNGNINHMGTPDGHTVRWVDGNGELREEELKIHCQEISLIGICSK